MRQVWLKTETSFGRLQYNRVDADNRLSSKSEQKAVKDSPFRSWNANPLLKLGFDLLLKPGLDLLKPGLDLFLRPGLDLLLKPGSGQNPVMRASPTDRNILLHNFTLPVLSTSFLSLSLLVDIILF